MPRHRRVIVVVSLLLAATPLLARVPAGVDREQFLEAAQTILCDCGCHPQSVYDCECGRAEEMRQEIAAEIRAGKSGEQVVEAYVARYGETIRIAPTASGFNLVAWVGPGVAFLLAGLGVALLIRRWRRQQPAVATVDAGGSTSVPDEYLSRLNRELEEYDR